MGDTGRPCDENTMAVTGEIVVTSIGALEVGSHAQSSVPAGSGDGLIVKFTGRSGSGANDKADCGGHLSLNDAGLRLSTLLSNRELLGLGAMPDPGDGERVGLPPVGLNEPEVGVAARLDINIAGEMHGDADSLPRHCLHKSLRPATARPVVVNDAHHAGQAISKPEREDGNDERQLREATDSGDVR